MAPPEPPAATAPAGYTLVELLLVLTLLAVLTALAVPALDGAARRMRVQGAVRRLATDLHLARMTAVREAAPVDVRLQAGDGGCVVAYRIARRAPPAPVAVRAVAGELRGGCMRFNGGDRLTFDGRGLASSGGKTITVSAGPDSAAVVVSFAGRIRIAG